MATDSPNDHYRNGMAWLGAAEADPDGEHAATYAAIAHARFTAALCMTKFGTSLGMARAIGTAPTIAVARNAPDRWVADKPASA
jgi:hypothetical protein